MFTLHCHLLYCHILRNGRDLRDIRVFQSQPTQVRHAHGCPATDEDEEGDELVGKEEECKFVTSYKDKTTNSKELVLLIPVVFVLRSVYSFFTFMYDRDHDKTQHNTIQNEGRDERYCLFHSKHKTNIYTFSLKPLKMVLKR